MKILDIINSHETLDEGLKQDTADLISKASHFLKGTHHSGISNEIDNVLNQLGRDLKRSPELAQAERSLIQVDKTIKLDRGSRATFEEMANSLASNMVAKGETSLYQNNPITEIRKMYPDPATAPQWLNSSGTKFKELNDKEFLDWLTQYSEAKAKVMDEIKKAKSAPAAPKSKAEKEAEKITDQKRQLEKDQIKLAKSRLARQIEQEAKAQKLADGRFSLNYLDGAFITTEVAKIGAQWRGSRNEINRWEASGQLPADVASVFPEVTATSKLPVSGGDRHDPKQYETNEDRVTTAANWARAKLLKQVIVQLLGGTVAFATAHVAKGLGGGLVGWSSHLSRFNKLIAWMGRKNETAKATTDVISKMLSGMSQVSKYMFVDYFLSAVNNEAWNVKDAARAVNAVLPDAVYNDLNIEHTADINKAIASMFVADTYNSVESFADSDIAKQIKGALDASYVAPGVIVEPVVQVGKWIKSKFDTPDINVDVPATPGPIPGVGTPVNPASTSTVTSTPPQSASDASAGQDQATMSGDTSQSSTTAPPVRSPLANPPKTNKQRRPQADDEFLNESINESLKKKVALLMKS